MYVNTEALKKAGVEAPKTWEEFEAAAPKLKEAGFIPLVQAQLTWQFTENFFARNNIQFATNNNGYDSIADTKINMTDPNLVMMFDKLTPEEILEVNIPTAIPLAYTFDQDWNVVDKHYIGDPEVIAAKIEAVANQGKAKK